MPSTAEPYDAHDDAVVGAEEATALRGVAQIGGCSGVFIAPSVLLTSGHCVTGQNLTVHTAERDIPIDNCAIHPNAAAPRHDLAVCRVASHHEEFLTASLTSVETGATITLAGFGKTGAWSRSTPRLRVVQTSMSRSADGASLAGDAEHTACLGDSGGPVLAGQAGDLQVVGVIVGPSGAICASATEWATLGENAAWLEAYLTPPSPTPINHLTLLAALLAMVVATAVLARRALEKRA